MKRLITCVLILTMAATACFAADRLPHYKTEVDKTQHNDEFLGCSLACAIGWTMQNSSHLPSQGKNTYVINNTQDGNFKTCWAEGASGSGIGQWIQFTLKDYPGRDNSEGVAFRGISFANGYGKSKKHYRDNGAVKQFRLDFNGKPKLYIDLADSMNNQYAAIPHIMVKPGDKIRLVITKVYPGRKYSDTCLTEVVLKGAH